MRQTGKDAMSEVVMESGGSKLLNNTNYATWHTRMKMFLVSKDLWFAVRP